MKKKYAYIHTIGCQMNVHDSDQIRRVLAPTGYEPAVFPESADLIILNTCTIRAKAEQKAFSFLGRLAALKRKRPELVVGVGGCLAQQEGGGIFRRMPHIDFIFGTRAINRLPGIIQRTVNGTRRIVDVDMADDIGDRHFGDTLKNTDSPSRFATIMRGCDNYCAYCVVPYVRGRETSRRPDDILEEIRVLRDTGVKEVTLLGQNVNSYGKTEGFCTFSELLLRVSKLEGIERIRFTTSHPKDFSEDLIYAFKELDKLCPHLHLPVQSGSNRVLKLMNRGYTREQYLEKIDRLRRLCPGVEVSTDIIVGFPGETVEDFNDTAALIKFIEYGSLFAFKYSDRPNAPATHFAGKVPEGEKKSRLAQVLKLQERITLEKNAALVGTTPTILVDGHGKIGPKIETTQWSGRTPTNKIVNFMVDEVDLMKQTNLIGLLIPVNIERALSHSLWGRPVGIASVST